MRSRPNLGCTRNAMRPVQRYLLPHRGDLKRPISESTLNQGLKTLGFDGLLTGHGIRATISTALNEFGYPSAWVAAQLSHVTPQGNQDAYNHAEHIEQRRRMMQDWADRLDLLERGNVDAARAPARGVPAELLQWKEAGNVLESSSTEHAPMVSRLYSPGIGPDASTSTEMNCSRIISILGVHRIRTNRELDIRHCR